MVAAVENGSSKGSATPLQSAGLEKNHGRIRALSPRTRLKGLEKRLGIEESAAAPFRLWYRCRNASEGITSVDGRGKGFGTGAVSVIEPDRLAGRRA